MAAMVRSVDYDGESKGRENQGLRECSGFQLEAPDSKHVGTAFSSAPPSEIPCSSSRL
jgi:hypothetical protein